MKFKKGQKVYRFNNWDGKGVWSYELFTVKSCGKIQMTLEKESDGEMLKHLVYPGCTYGGYAHCVLASELPTIEDVVAKGKEFSAWYIDRQIEHYERCLASSDHPAYLKAIQKDMDIIKGASPSVESHENLEADVRGRHK